MKSKSLILLATFILLLLSALATAFYSFQEVSPQRIAAEISSHLEVEMRKMDKEAEGVLKKLSTNPEGQISSNAGFSFFVFSQHELISWSDNTFIPSIQAVQDSFSIKLVKNPNEDYLIKKWQINADQFLIAELPLYSEFQIRNNYLSPQWNEGIFPQGNVIIFEPGAVVGMPVYLKKNCVFKIDFSPYSYSFHIHRRWTAVILFFLSAIFFVLVVYNFLPVVKRKGAGIGFIFLTCILVPLRILMVELNFPNTLIKTALFDPKNFASSSYNASFGDLLLNELVVLALCYYLFKNYRYFKIWRVIFQHRLKGVLILIFSVLSVLFSILFPYVVIQTVLNNSSVVLDISQSLHFDLLHIAALLALLLSWISAFLFAHTFIRLPISRRRIYYFFIYAGVGLIIFILINTYSHQFYLPSLVMAILYFILVYSLKLFNGLKKFSYATFLYLFVWIVCMSINGAYAINRFTEKKKVVSQFRFAANFLVDRDYFSEYLLHETAVKIANDQFVRLRMSSPFLSKDIVRQKIRQKFLPNYFNKYDVYIKLFHSDGSSYDNAEPSFSEVINLYDKEAFRTEYKDVYFVNSPSGDVTQKYVVIVPVQRFNITTNYISIELALKKIIPENVYPELLVDNRFQQFYKTQDVSYAVFSNKTVVFSAGEFNYEGLFDRRWLGDVNLYAKGIKESGYIHVALEDEIGRAAVVSSKLSSVSYVIANFSFLLVLGLSIVLLLFLISGLISYLSGQKLFFSARIQLVLNLAFFLPLIIACFTTLRLTSLSSQDQLNEEYLNKSKKFGEQIAGILDGYLNSTNENQVEFENQLADLAKLTTLDANVFNPNGTLDASSQPQIFESGLFSTWINPKALSRIRNGENLFIEQDHTGKLKYFVSYAALKSSQSGKLIGILAVPFFQSGYSLDKVQITIFTNILNIFAGIFIVLLLLSYLVSEWLTFPLKFITQSLRKTSLTKTNQPLTWKSNDEIGLMVKEYNQMLFKLSESKAELEQNQREKTWREVAQQVAHEIKNPLTPMKLTIQQMERAIKAGTNSSEKTEKALTSLLMQVDALNDIASSFSSFAKMPQPNIQKIELVSLVKRIVELHSQSGRLIFKKHENEIFVQGDEQLLGRTFSNIILNALQAARPGVTAVVDITLQKQNTRCVVLFKDNGIGIDAAHRDQIFVPHFSTKKSGSGLGLAIAKQSIEQMGGRIWFESTVDKGATFYIELIVST